MGVLGVCEDFILHQKLFIIKFMIKRIILLSVVYAVVSLTITLYLSNEKLFIPALIMLNILFAITIIVFIYKKIRLSKSIAFVKNNTNSSRNEKNYFAEKLDHTSTKKISKRPFILGFEKNLISDEDFYYDQDFFYAVSPSGSVSRFPLTDIVELRGTGTQINNIRVWQVKVIKGNGFLDYRFAHNFTIWNKNFLNFYKLVKQIRPDAIRSKWSLWRM